MDDNKIYNLGIKKAKWIAHIIYWLIAACLLFFVFSNRNYDYNIRLILVSFIIIISYVVVYLVNYFFIPKFLFAGKTWIFIYVILGIFITILWLVLYSSIINVIYSAYLTPNIMLPQKDDIIILVSGNYLVIIFATVIHFIKESYRRLIEKNDIEKQKQLAEIKLKEASLKLLQGQIHPHFLFNMLNNLYGLVKENTDSSREVIMKLSELLDYMLYECDKPNVCLKSEAEFIRNYIELERIRHDESFNVRFNFSDQRTDTQIAPLILFPFVENAFKHGLHDPENSFIYIDLKVNDNKIQFKIENSISDVKKDRYLKQEGKGIGLRNIKERLELIYKDKFLLDISCNQNNYKADLEIELS